MSRSRQGSRSNSHTDLEVLAVAGRGRRFTARTRLWLRAIVVMVAATAGLCGFAITGTVNAQSTPIKHIVVLYMENHTFDNMLGYWCKRHARRCPDGGMPRSVTLSNGHVVISGIMPDIVPKVAHSVASEQKAIDGGKMDGWQHVRGCGAKPSYACIGGYFPAQVPNVTTLAKRFAISDRTFSMADSPSWGGHLYAVMGQLDGFLGNNPRPARGVTPRPGWGCDSRQVTPWKPPGGTVRKVPSCVPDYSLRRANGGAFKPTPVKHAPTIPTACAALSCPGGSTASRSQPAAGSTGPLVTPGTSAPRSPSACTPTRDETTCRAPRSSRTRSPATCPASPSSRRAGRTPSSASTTTSP